MVHEILLLRKRGLEFPMIDDKAPLTRIETEFQNATSDITIAMKAFGTGLLRGLHICFPACVYSFDRTTHIAKVMPLVKQAFYNGEWVYLRRQPFDTTVRNIQAGGFTIDFPLYIGDTGWVFASDRDTQLLKREGALTNSVLATGRNISVIEDDYQQKPNTLQMNKWTFGFFLPDNWGKWETHRFKDSPGVAIGNALYIGSSIDTEDEDQIGGQKGDAYEKKTTSSVVLQKGGGAYVLSSTHVKPDDAEGRCRTSKVSVVGDTVEIAVSDMTEDTPIDASITIGTDSGIVIRQDNPKDKLNFIASVQEDQFTMRLMDIENKKTVSMTFENGQLDVHTTDAVNIFSQKDVNIKGAENAYVSAKDARVVAEETASVSARTVSASAEEDVNIAAGQNINLTAPDSVNIVTASNVSVLSKKVGAQISVTTKSKDATIVVNSEGENATIDLQTEGNYAAIGVSSAGEAANINIDTAGEQSDISINSAQSNVDITAKEEVSVSAKTVTVSAEESASVSAGQSVSISGGQSVSVSGGQSVSVSGNSVEVSGSNIALNGTVTINGTPLTKGHVQPENQNAWVY